MKNNQNIKIAFDRTAKAISRQPAIARSIRLVKAVYKGGLACDIECGQWTYRADMPESAGGKATGPTPGTYMRASLASCMLITIILWAANLDIPVEALHVEVTVVDDDRGLYGVGDTPPRWGGITYRVIIKSSAPESKIHKLLDIAHAHNPMRDNLEHAFHIEREVSISR